jgi:CHAT domain-containing protein/tetratricopeptide (TPR) repeat protein
MTRSILLPIVIVLVALLPTIAAAGQTITDGAILELGQTVERPLLLGEKHSYSIRIAAGDYARVRILPLGAPLIVRLSHPDGSAIEIRSTVGDQEPLFLSAVAEQDATYRLDVQLWEKLKVEGAYRICVVEAGRAADVQRKQAEAEKAFSDGESLGNQAGSEARRQTLAKYAKALSIWTELRDTRGQGLALLAIGQSYIAAQEPKTALDYLTKALPLLKASGPRNREADALNEIGFVYWSLGDSQKALELYNQAQAVQRESGARRGEAITLDNMGLVYIDIGEPAKGKQCVDAALSIFRSLGDRGQEALTLNNLAGVYITSGQPQEGINSLRLVLPIRRQLDDKAGEALALINIAATYADLGDYEQALYYFDQALPLAQALGDKRLIAGAHHNLGLVYASLGDRQKALDHYEQALKIRRELGNRLTIASTLSHEGRVYHAMGDHKKAIEYYMQSLELARATGDRRGEAITLSNLGEAYLSLGDTEHALEAERQALPVLHGTGDLLQEEVALCRLSRVERARGNLEQALTRINAALEIEESIRSSVVGRDLRSSYSALIRDAYATKIELLQSLDSEKPGEGFAAQAFRTSEQARARGLLDMLIEARADISQGVDPSLLRKERELQRLLNAKAERRLRLLSGQHTEEQATALEKEINSVILEYKGVQDEVDSKSPQYASLKRPRSVAAAEVQQQLLDQDTVLLEYSLGAERSFLWAITQSQFASYQLPKRAQIEAAAREVYDLLTARNKRIRFETREERQNRILRADRDYNAAAAALSNMLLGQVAPKLDKHRVVIVAEGALQYIPFGALPIPLGKPDAPARAGLPRSLVMDHEVAILPSASVLLAVRQHSAGRRPAPKTVAILADPVFDTNDPRLNRAGDSRKHIPHDLPKEKVKADASDLSRSASDVGIAENELAIPRLPHTRQEAEVIASLVPKEAVLEALDFEASLPMATSQALSQYRILHFATHGLLNAQHPELSGIVLSLVDKNGAPKEGFLEANQIFNLSLPGTDLAVLSACSTGLATGEVKGEGVSGLTRAFMYAGVPSLIVSLWAVNDEATAELMKRFYEGILKKGLRPAAALRSAQTDLSREAKWRAPYYWAGFTLQGEWK